MYVAVAGQARVWMRLFVAVRATTGKRSYLVRRNHMPGLGLVGGEQRARAMGRESRESREDCTSAKVVARRQVVHANDLTISARAE